MARRFPRSGFRLVVAALACAPTLAAAQETLKPAAQSASATMDEAAVRAWAKNLVDQVYGCWMETSPKDRDRLLHRLAEDTPAAAAYVTRVLNRPEPQLRAAALTGVKQVADTMRRVPWRPDDQPHVQRIMAAWSVLVPELIAAIAAPETSVATRRALGQILTTLAAVGRDPIMASAYSKKMWQDQLPALGKLTAHAKNSVRLTALEVLASLEQDAAPAMPALIRAAKDQDRFVRWSAIRALQAVGMDQDALQAIAALQNDADQDVRRAAVAALQAQPGGLEALARQKTVLSITTPGAQPARPAAPHLSPPYQGGEGGGRAKTETQPAKTASAPSETPSRATASRKPSSGNKTPERNTRPTAPATAKAAPDHTQKPVPAVPLSASTNNGSILAPEAALPPLSKRGSEGGAPPAAAEETRQQLELEPPAPPLAPAPERIMQAPEKLQHEPESIQHAPRPVETPRQIQQAPRTLEPEPDPAQPPPQPMFQPVAKHPAKVNPTPRVEHGNGDPYVDPTLRMGSPQPNPVAAQVARLKSDQLQDQFEAVRALGRLGPRAADAVPMLAEALLKGDVLVRREVPLALAQIGDAAKVSIAVLERALEDEDTDVKVNAARALLELTAK